MELVAFIASRASSRGLVIFVCEFRPMLVLRSCPLSLFELTLTLATMEFNPDDGQPTGQDKEDISKKVLQGRRSEVESTLESHSIAIVRRLHADAYCWR